MASILKFKLLPNLCNNSKISKNKSCSKFKVLQLCFYNHTQIRSTFLNANLNSKGDTLSTFCLFKLLQIFLNNFENSKNKLCTTQQALHLCFKARPQNVLQFFHNNFENSKNKLCITCQALHFCFKTQPQNVLRF